MDKEKVLKKAKKNYDEALKRIELADFICKKVEPHLPEEWRTHTGGLLKWGQIEFCKNGKTNALEFRVVCNLVGKILGRSLERFISGDEAHQTLIGYTYIHSEDNETAIDVHVELGNPEGCKITFKRTWETKAVVDEACLGIRKAK